ncbi:hypothetical protein [Paenisporosarcina antarctica]|uniref:Uncharacterized protein n=1 Tax=Paenisporosarcina antarctica TaxID=417367 RepID=A0A4P7A1L1_9BACL|nr:hypothetical protein [Paenisporosarcina antarctica]QBP42742.1 hypothetical protein E2636_17055 [Paenisporosarcina antarctica]
MGFWKLFFSFIITYTLSNLTFLHMEFFHYKIFSELTVINLAKLLIELFIFACIYMTVYFLFEHAPKWVMRYKYDLAEKERLKQ